MVLSLGELLGAYGVVSVLGGWKRELLLATLCAACFLEVRVDRNAVMGRLARND